MVVNKPKLLLNIINNVVVFLREISHTYHVVFLGKPIYEMPRRNASLDQIIMDYSRHDFTSRKFSLFYLKFDFT